MLYRFQLRGQIYEISLDRQGERYRATVDGQTHDLEVLDAQPGQISLRFDGCPLTLYWAADGADKWVLLNGCTYKLERPSPRGARLSTEPGGAEAVRAPMPAQVRAVQVEEGDAVTPGQTLLLLEAMKMEIRIRAPAAGRVIHLRVAAGQTVEKDQLLAEIGE
jgi:acetyl/propionyl-CoA carboxylase alpha subunit